MPGLLIITDIWESDDDIAYILQQTVECLVKVGFETEVWTPATFKLSFKDTCYFAPLTCFKLRFSVFNKLKDHEPDMVHIETLGPLGLAACHACKALKIKFSTAYHVDLAHELRHSCLTHIWGKSYQQWFYSNAEIVMVPFKSLFDKIKVEGAKNVGLWPWGVDLNMFNQDKRDKHHAVRSTLLYVGSVNRYDKIEKFLKLEVNDIKIVIGNGPDLRYFENKYPSTLFLGVKKKDELVHYYSEASVLVITTHHCVSNLAILEAIAFGVPVVGNLVPGLQDLVSRSRGFLADNLDMAVEIGRKIHPNTSDDVALKALTWPEATKAFIRNLIIIP